MRSLIRSLRPDRFEDLIALVALYRPGPMSNDWHNAYATARTIGRRSGTRIRPPRRFSATRTAS